MTASATRVRAARPSARRGSRRPLVIGLVVLVVLVAVYLVTYAVQAVRARDALTAAGADVRALEAAVLAGRMPAADARLADLQEHAAAARRATAGPVWRTAAHLPLLGAPTRAVRTVAVGVDDVASSPLPALLDAARVVGTQSLLPDDGVVDVTGLERAEPDVVAADAAVQRLATALSRIDVAGLPGAVGGPVRDVRDELARVARVSATAARAVRLLPPMLGADGPRTYLVMVQNNAEPRATGGIPGTVVLLRADEGALELVGTATGGELGDLDGPVLPLTDAELALFGDDLGADLRDVTFTPDFPRAAGLAARIWSDERGTTLDGVVAVDPVALDGLLAATGPVALGDGATLAPGTAADRLLNGVYLDVADPEQQDAFFAAAARAVFAALTRGTGGPDAVDALARAAGEGRLLVWSAHDDEQALLAPTVLSGALTREPGDTAVVGVYLNDGTEAKIGYYLDLDVRGVARECRADGSQLVDLELTLTNRAPVDAAALPGYVTGGGAVVAPGTARTNLLLYAPAGGAVEDVEVDGGPARMTAQVHDGLAVAARTFDLAPGQATHVRMTVRTGPQQAGPVVVRSTPLARGTGRTELPTSCG